MLQDDGLGIHSLVSRREALIVRHAARFLIQPDCLWRRLMRARYAEWSRGISIQIARRCSFLWREICARGPVVMDQIRYLIDDGRSVEMIQDA